MRIKNTGNKIVAFEATNLSSPQGILLKKGISGDKLPYVIIMIVMRGIINKKESKREIRAN
jgi:hypothetical protein